MVPPNGRIAALLLPALLALGPAAAQAQQRNCPHQNGVPPSGQFSGQSMNSAPPQMSQTSFQGQMSQTCGMRNQTSQTSTTQQMQLVAMQQMQFVALQQQMQAMQQMEMVAGRQQPAPFQQLQQVPLPPLGLVQKKPGSDLLKEMTAVQQRLDGLQEAARRNDLQPTEASAAQQEVNALQQEVDALPKPSHTVLERMSALRRQTDEVMQQATAKPTDVLAAVRASR